MSNKPLTRDDLDTLSPEEIVKAKSEGRLDHLLGVPAATGEARAKAEAGKSITRAELDQLAAAGRHDLVAKYARTPNLVTD